MYAGTHVFVTLFLTQIVTLEVVVVSRLKIVHYEKNVEKVKKNLKRSVLIYEISILLFHN